MKSFPSDRSFECNQPPHLMIVRSRNLDIPKYFVMTVTIGNSSSVREGEGIAVTERFSLQMTWEAPLQISLCKMIVSVLCSFSE